MFIMAQIVQWNSRSVKNKKIEITSLIKHHHPVIVALSETWLRPESSFRIPGFACLRDDRHDGHGGCALLIKKSLVYSQIPLSINSQNINIVAARILNKTFVSIYIPYPNNNIKDELVSLLLQLPTPLILLGDFNCHHISWGCYYSDSFSNVLIDIFDRINVCILNDGSPTRRVYPGQDPRSAVDLSACPPDIAISTSWKVLPHTHGSDHFPIVISLDQYVTPVLPPKPLLKYRLNKVDWKLYGNSVETFLSRLEPRTSGTLQRYDLFQQAILSAAETHFPLKQNCQKFLSPPWWDSECTTVIQTRDESETTYNNSMTPENFIAFQKNSAKSRRTLSKKKKNGWKGFCESLSPRSPSGLVWKSIKRYRGSKKMDSPITNDPAMWIHKFESQLAPPFVPDLAYFPTSNNFRNSDRLDKEFSFEELQIVLGAVQDSSPGEDGIPYSFLKNLTVNGKQHLLDLLNNIFITGNIPQSWKTQIIIPILKPGKDPAEHNSYRPIALSSTLCKVLEHMIKNRLEWFVESRDMLGKTQFGFRKSRSTADSLSMLATNIHLAFSRGEYLVGIFLDISSAYDSVDLPILRRKMLNLSIPARIVHFVMNLFMDRSIKIRVNEELRPPRTVWKGLPQGSVLSPLLYNIYTSDLELAVDSFCNTLQYADDLALYSSSNSISEISIQLNSAMHYLSIWLSEHGLTLSASKSKAVIFTRKRTIPDLEIRYEDQIIQMDSSAKFLGVIFDSKLTGSQHFSYIAEKSEKGVNIIRALSGVWWGSHPYCQKLLYNALIRSHFDYGSFIFEPCNKEGLEKLNLVQTKCLRIIVGAMKSSPNAALMVECVDPPLDLRRQYLSDRYVSKLIQVSSHPLLPYLDSLSHKVNIDNYWVNKDPPRLVRSYRRCKALPQPISQSPAPPIFNCSFDALIFKPNVLLDLGISKNDREANRKLYQALGENWMGWTIIFTDASRLTTNGNVGSAVWIPKYNVVLLFKNPCQTSVFTGEAIAIHEAV
ncbi:RNA-directed DNA polymerase from mobile element jockey isoform X2 [Bicyclus anynana]|uniref:RNA-directed DNA polymerase from mobile element jockey isoform X2 n=1 Tax=Bicyclus anynana TaxID=110368 RepID=A0ABM3LKU9_BICAN|nr:RNA-directed DNA polymerase from mobile element jockey isoform X2 [Bicyclus anynana]